MHQPWNFGSVESRCFSPRAPGRWKVEKERNLITGCEVKMLHPGLDRKGSFHACFSCQAFLCSFELVKRGRRAFHAGLRKADWRCERARLLTQLCSHQLSGRWLCKDAMQEGCSFQSLKMSGLAGRDFSNIVEIWSSLSECLVCRNKTESFFFFHTREFWFTDSDCELVWTERCVSSGDWPVIAPPKQRFSDLSAPNSVLKLRLKLPNCVVHMVCVCVCFRANCRLRVLSG